MIPTKIKIEAIINNPNATIDVTEYTLTKQFEEFLNTSYLNKPNVSFEALNVTILESKLSPTNYRRKSRCVINSNCAKSQRPL